MPLWPHLRAMSAFAFEVLEDDEDDGLEERRPQIRVMDSFIVTCISRQSAAENAFLYSARVEKLASRSSTGMLLYAAHSSSDGNLSSLKLVGKETLVLPE